MHGWAWQGADRRELAIGNGRQSHGIVNCVLDTRYIPVSRSTTTLHERPPRNPPIDRTRNVKSNSLER